MPLPQMRPAHGDGSEPVLHDLPPVRFDGATLAVRLAVRRAEDGIWRARLHFSANAGEPDVVTAEIFCATTEQDLWAAVRDIRDHHLRDLYRSLTA
jgi:hypothetical protein